MQTHIVPFEEPKETPEQKRKRLATELRLIQQQLNSKLMEILDNQGMSVVTTMGSGEILEDSEAIVQYCDISYQTPARHY